MNTETFFDNFEQLAEAPNGVVKLRELILHLAVQGKLVEQVSDNVPASEMMRRIMAECASLPNGVRNKKSQEVKVSGIPFPVPKNWTWIRLAEAGHDWGQKKPDRTFTYIDVSAIDKERGVISDNVYTLHSDEAPSRARKIVRKGTVIYSTVRPYLLNIAVVEKDFDPEPIASTAFAVIHPFTGIEAKYLYYYLRSKPFIEYVESEMKGMAYPAVNDGSFYNGLMPVPPTEEQKLIVAKVDELMKLCDELEQRQQNAREARVHLNNSALEHLLAASTPEEFKTHWQRINDNFDLFYDVPETIGKLRQSILQLAVEGKLTRRDSKDTPSSVWLKRIGNERGQLIAKESRSAALSESLTIFNVPANWKWVLIDDIYDVSGGIQKTPKRKPSSNYFSYLRVANVYRGRLELSQIESFELFEGELERWMLKAGDILVVEGNGSESEIGRCAIWNGEIPNCVHQNHLIRCRPVLQQTSPFTLLFLNSPHGMAEMRRLSITTSGLYNLSVSKIKRIAIPFPPIEEQKRIVAKVDELMKLCDALEAKLNQAHSLSESLTASVVTHIFSAEENTTANAALLA